MDQNHHQVEFISVMINDVNQSSIISVKDDTSVGHRRPPDAQRNNNREEF